MAVFRVEKNENYSVMANYHFRDKSLSWKAKGILSNMLSLPDDWDYSLAGLTMLSNDGAGTTRSAIKELERHGYLIRRPIREKGKIVDWEYLIFEYPQVENQDVEKPFVKNPQVEKSQVENPPQLNTNGLNTDGLSTNGLSTYNRPRATRFIPPTIDEVTAYCRERNNTVDPERFIDHYTANGWMVGKNKMKDWKASVRTWERRETKKPAPVDYGDPEDFYK